LILIPAHTASPQSYSAIPSGVALTANANELGLLEVACVSPDACIKQSWRLEFNLRPNEQQEGPSTDQPAAVCNASVHTNANVSTEVLEAARTPAPAFRSLFSGLGSKCLHLVSRLVRPGQESVAGGRRGEGRRC
jgi:hypothetical protein